MKVKIKRFDQSLKLPAYKTAGAAAMDLSSRIDMEILPQTVGYVPLNIALQVPDGYFVLLAARSSLHKMGLMMANGIGIGDYDYRGNGDEYQAALFNFSQKPVSIRRGDRLLQMIVLPRERIQLEEEKEFSTEDRGGFGSTGKV